MQRILRLPELKKATGLGRSRIYDLVAQNKFPRPIALSERARGWLESEVSDWQQARIAERDSTNASR